jgi:predicted nucleic acid-binding protein
MVSCGGGIEMIEAVKVHYLDASVLVKLYVDDENEKEGRGIIRNYFNNKTSFCTTSLCFAETLGVLKNKFKNSRREEYMQACKKLVTAVWGRKIEIDEVPIAKHGSFDEKVKQIDFFKEAERLVGDYKIDFTDAFQVVTILRGKYSVLAGESRSILITADKGLSEAARGEGARVWNILTEPEPT